MRYALAFALLFAFVSTSAPAQAPRAGQAGRAARQAAETKRNAEKAVREAERRVAEIERRIAGLRKKLEEAESAGAAAPAAPQPDRAAMKARIAELQRDLPILNSIINKLTNNLPLNAAEQQLLRRLIGSSIPVKGELLQILQQMRDAWESELERLKQELASAPSSPAPAPAPAGPDPGALRDELENAERELEAAKKDLEDKRGEAGEAMAQKELSDLELEAARLRQQKARLEEQIRRKAEQARRAAEKLDREREKASSGSEAAQAMSGVLGWTREVVTKLAEFLAGDIGEAIASAATTQLEVGAAALAALPGLIPGVEGLTRNPDGTYSFNKSGQSTLIPLVDALNEFVRAQKELESAMNAYSENQKEIEAVDQKIAAAKS